MLVARAILFGALGLISLLLFISLIPESVKDFNDIRTWTKTNCSIISYSEMQSNGKQYVQFNVFILGQKKMN